MVNFHGKNITRARVKKLTIIVVIVAAVVLMVTLKYLIAFANVFAFIFISYKTGNNFSCFSPWTVSSYYVGSRNPEINMLINEIMTAKIAPVVLISIALRCLFLSSEKSLAPHCFIKHISKITL